ncbi:VOC family protein [Actinophytocola algeriensis]|uniref:Putative enzyme related to lactoylglutathione lyase n=1 Tax=Actinophytocola algeriensis TaxID=1768010 RepID=A0A7W7VI78_9PSEU|nr:VOC family protein [Actinophytocola algeriensis]MBB4911277.1 putative enzyme related to lactoylglutathione lyase [Actinophytocola algeriensis]MBE1479216.1 putative enzyme related to lactoylglutathione lyase [Actinophytocola algeriensis]
MRVQHITVDCASPYELASFWSVVTGWPISAEDSPGDDEVLLEPPDPAMAELLFIRVPEPKAVKNRVHLDLVPTERTRDEEVDRLTAAGASVVADQRTPEGRGWVVLADPEGNEFCVEKER